jgi:hypothetical protein
MYDLSVQGAHNFYVGDAGWLVHNCITLQKSSTATAHNTQNTHSNYRAGLEAAWPIPNSNLQWEAHHIVPWDHPRAERAREILQAKNINLHSPANLTWLPANTSQLAEAAKHFSPVPLSHHGSGVHTNATIDVLNRRLAKLAEADTQTVVNELTYIANELSQGRLPQ